MAGDIHIELMLITHCVRCACNPSLIELIVSLLCFAFLCSVDDQRYFTCQPKYGSMVPIAAVEIGDFPRESDGLDDDEI